MRPQHRFAMTRHSGQCKHSAASRLGLRHVRRRRSSSPALRTSALNSAALVPAAVRAPPAPGRAACCAAARCGRPVRVTPLVRTRACGLRPLSSRGARRSLPRRSAAARSSRRPVCEPPAANERPPRRRAGARRLRAPCRVLRAECPACARRRRLQRGTSPSARGATRTARLCLTRKRAGARHRVGATGGAEGGLRGRRDFLTGFHKRKKQRRKARSAAANSVPRSRLTRAPGGGAPAGAEGAPEPGGGAQAGARGGRASAQRLC
jgi:hypothetical protein